MVHIRAGLEMMRGFLQNYTCLTEFYLQSFSFLLFELVA